MQEAIKEVGDVVITVSTAPARDGDGAGCSVCTGSFGVSGTGTTSRTGFFTGSTDVIVTICDGVK